MLASSENLIAGFNQQVGNEMGASMQYISIASFFDTQSLTGLSRFFYAQAEEEREHAMRFVRFVVDSGSELRILRDRRSHRFTREAFWNAAARMGYTDAFPRSAPFESLEAGHMSFQEVGLRPAAAIIGAGAPVDPPGEGEAVGVEEDTLGCCSAESLQTVGLVTLQTLETQAERLARIDRAAGVTFVGEAAGSGGDAGPPSPEETEAAPGTDQMIKVMGITYSRKK